MCIHPKANARIMDVKYDVSDVDTNKRKMKEDEDGRWLECRNKDYPQYLQPIYPDYS